MTSYLTRALPYLLLVPAVLPLVFIDGMLYPYVAPKTLLLRGAMCVALAVFAYLACSGQAFYYDRLRKPFAWIPGALLAVAYLASLFGIDFYRSFWSNFDRGDGLLSLTAVVVFFYLTLIYADAHFLRRMVIVVAAAASVMAGYAVLQWIQIMSGVDLPLVATARGRIGSTFGNAAFLAGYLGLAFFVTLAAARSLLGRWRTAAYWGAGLQLLAIFIAATRGTLLAFIVVGLVAVAWLAVRGQGNVRSYARSAIIGAVIAGSLFIGFRGYLAEIPIEAVHRLATISLTENTVASRVFIWGHTIPEALKHPLLGTGAESINVVFNRIYDPGKIVEQWFDRTHNSFLDYFVQYGAFGFILYAALILAAMYLAYRRHQMGDGQGTLFLLLALAYVVQDFFVFDTMPALWLLLSVFAILLIRSQEYAPRPLALSFPQTAPLIAGVLLLIPLWWIVWLPLSANLKLAEGYLYHVIDVRRATASMKEGFEIGTYADLEYGYQAYQMYTDRQQHSLMGEARVIAYEYARDVLQENYEKYPYDARTAVYFGHVLDSAPPEEQPDEAMRRKIFTQAMELSPKRSQPWYMLANIYIKKADQLPAGAEKNQLYRQAISLIEGYALMVPGTSEPRFILATLNLTIGDQAAAKRWAEEALPLYEHDRDLPVAKRAARYYITAGEWALAKRFLGDVVGGSPGDYTVLYDFAKAAFLAGDEAEGAAAAARVKQNAPQLFASDPAFVNAYESWVAAHP